MQGILWLVSCMRVRDGPVTSIPLISVRTQPILSDDPFFSPRKFEMIRFLVVQDMLKQMIYHRNSPQPSHQF